AAPVATKSNTRKTNAKKGGKKKTTAEAVEGDQRNNTTEYALPAGAHIVVQNGQMVYAGEVIAKIPRQSKITKDITGGLPRVAELFEARRPKKAAEISRIEGTVTIEQESSKGWSFITVRDAESESEVVEVKHKIPAGKQIIVNNGDFVRKGQPLTDGDIVLHDMLEICGPQETQQHLVNSVQSVYQSQGVDINDKHIEIIVRQMMRRVRIISPGNTKFLIGESVDIREFQDENLRVSDEGGEAARSEPILQGITRASLATDSFISAASFQDTTRVLTEAATSGKRDNLRGFKENVIMGRLIPAGTGFRTAQNIKLEYVTDGGKRGEFVSDATLASEKATKDLTNLDGFLK
ncbi:MAG: hypothetical protein IJS15_05295, partial [Victivallales bacterium]|nr:hypothetical protein [Victivallales bacterium]